MFIKDLHTGVIRKYGENHHDSLVIADDGRTLYYGHLQNGDTSLVGYRFCIDESGKTPEEDEVLIRHGADAYFNIRGFNEDYYNKGMTDAISALWDFCEIGNEGICDTVTGEYGEWCEEHCKNLCPECVRKFIEVKKVKNGGIRSEGYIEFRSKYSHKRRHKIKASDPNGGK